MKTNIAKLNVGYGVSLDHDADGKHGVYVVQYGAQKERFKDFASAWAEYKSCETHALTSEGFNIGEFE